MITGSIAYNRWVAKAQGVNSIRVERENVGLSNALLIPGLQTPLSELRSLLFSQGRQGGIWMPSLSPTMIAGNTFGSGVQTFLDLSGRGNNATQATSGNRPAWGRVPKTGRRNLLERTGEFENAYWDKGRVTLSAGLAPDGGSATVMTETEDTGTHRVSRTTPGVGGTDGNTSYILSAFYKSNTGNPFACLSMTDLDGGRQVRAWFNLSSGTVGVVENVGAATGAAASITSIGDGWFRCVITGRMNNTGQIVAFLGMAETNGVQSYAGSTGRSVLLWRPQVEIGSTATPTTPQRVTNAFDVTEVGQRDCYYLQPDGSDDSMATGSINFTGTDKVTVFAAVRRLSNAARGTYLELTDSIASNNGAFHLTAPNGASSTFGFESKGTTLRDVESTVALSTSARILTAVGDISGDLASLQVDNGTPVTNTGDQGTGNYSNAVLRFYRRGGTSQPANLQDFGVIVVQGLVSASVAARVRRIMSRYAPGVSL